MSFTRLDSVLEEIEESCRAGRQAFSLDPGLTDSELGAIERKLELTFPPDLRHLLKRFVPSGEGFPDWRVPADLIERLDRPLTGIKFDIEHDVWSERWGRWGRRPQALDDALHQVEELVAAAPRLLPIYSHRFSPEQPSEPGNPVFSVHQTDAIVYGSDLASYLRREFFFSSDIPETQSDELKVIPFWTSLVEDPPDIRRA